MRTLSTAELIEQLKIGEQAVMVHDTAIIVVKRDLFHGIMITEDSTGGDKRQLPLTAVIMKATWILEEEISFETALEHIKAGREVICRYDERKTTYDNINDVIYIAEATDGKWYLSENNSSLD